jgi:glutamine synthetase
MLMAGLDGIQNRNDPGQAIDKNLYDLPPEEIAKVPSALDRSKKRATRLKPIINSFSMDMFLRRTW